MNKEEYLWKNDSGIAYQCESISLQSFYIAHKGIRLIGASLCLFRG
jgi:hypothetical protein